MTQHEPGPLPNNLFPGALRKLDSAALGRMGRWTLLFIPVVLCLTVLGQTYVERTSARQAAEAAERMTLQLQLENQQLREEIEALRSDPQIIEHVAREELHLVRPDEIVIATPGPERMGAGDRPERQSPLPMEPPSQ